jgi:hypothetical protein
MFVGVWVRLEVSHDIAVGEIRCDKARQSETPIKIGGSPNEWDDIGMVECEPDFDFTTKFFE